MITVVKFGGTSLNTRENRYLAINKIKKELDKKNKVVVVVSAMGRKNEPYATNSLLSFCDYLPNHQKDRLIAQGEILSSLVFENQCREQGILAHACTPTETGLISDGFFGQAKVLQVNTMWLDFYLKTLDVVIVPGFIGLSLSGHITTLGRGGSDKTAILVADALNVGHVMIYTDVDGIYDIDPKKNTSAKKYKSLNYNECLILVNQGACVMMVESVELAKSKGITFTVASTFSMNEGTKVSGN